MNEPTLLVLAAGLGRRFGGLKQLAEIGPHGEPLMDYAVYDAWRSGFRRAVFVIPEGMRETFHAQLGKRYAAHMEIAYAPQRRQDLPSNHAPPHEREKPWGTGHALWAAREALTTPFAVINADDYYGPGSMETIAAFLRARASPEHAAMVAFSLRATLSPHGPVSRGVCTRGDDGTLAKVSEHKKVQAADEGVTAVGPDGAAVTLRGDEPVSMNLWGLHPAFLNRLGEAFERFLQAHGDDAETEFLLPGVVQEEIEAGRLTVQLLPTEESWFGITYPQDQGQARHQIQKAVAEGTYPETPWPTGQHAAP